MPAARHKSPASISIEPCAFRCEIPQRESFAHLASHFPESRNATGAFALGNGVNFFGYHVPRPGGRLAGIGKGNAIGAP
jgi:hypothetical protein